MATEEEYLDTSEFLESEEVEMQSAEFTDITAISYGRNHIGCNIYKARRYGQWWTLKCLTQESMKHRQAREIFQKEFEVGISLWHPNIVRMIAYYPLGELNAQTIVMEYIDGLTLSEYIASNPSLERKIKVIDEIIDAMRYYMSKQVVHCDLKPNNILITRNGLNVKIIDFGLASTDSYNFYNGHAGTDEYCAPEQKTGNEDVDCRADFYALGKIMLTMGLPSRYKGFIRKCLAEDREKRYKNPTELYVAFEKAKKKKYYWEKAGIVAASMLVLGSAFYLGHYISTKVKKGVQEQKEITDGQLPALFFSDSIKVKDSDKMVYVVPSAANASFCPNGDTIPGPIPESEAVDLGLSVNWAPFNVGCKEARANELGGYYSLGDSTGKAMPENVEEFWATPPKVISGSESDLARLKWGGKWRMPTKNEFQELIDKCKWSLIEHRGAVSGYQITGPSGKSIFLAFAGHRTAKAYFKQGITGLYWTCTPFKGSKTAYSIMLDKYSVSINDYQDPIKGFSIRPVIDK